MQVQSLLTKSFSRNGSLPTREELEYMAFTGQYELVHAIIQRIPSSERARYCNKYIMSQTVWGGIQKMRKLLAVQAEESANHEKAFIDGMVQLFIQHCRKNGGAPREVFEVVLWWSEELIRLSLTEEAFRYLQIAVELKISKFPELQLQLLSRLAHLYSLKGELTRAYDILSHLVARPYLLTDRNRIPEILFNLSQAAVHLGDVGYYKTLLFLGLKLFYTDLPAREKFVTQLQITYERSYKLLLRPGISVKNKVNFLIHKLYFMLPDFDRWKLGSLGTLLRLGFLGYIYLLNYLRPGICLVNREQKNGKPFRLPPVTSQNGNLPRHRKFRNQRIRSDILITRAMGGIGDLLMMTPAIHALKQRHPERDIYLAIPKRYFAVFEHNPDVILLDIENAEIDFEKYRKWYNFSDCPAARVEARTAPRVKKSRIEIFAHALGISSVRLHRIGTKPRYVITPEELVFQSRFFAEHRLNGKTVIGIQLRADETYRDYPHMNELVKMLAAKYTVLVFDARPIQGFDLPNVLKIDSYNLRQAFAIAGGCQAIIAPDSAFVHLAAALDIPCVGLFGPIDGKIRTKHYPLCRFVDARTRLGCVACWRNERIPCKLTGMRPSVCMTDIGIDEILQALQSVMPAHRQYYPNGAGANGKNGSLPKSVDAPKSLN